MAIYPCDVKGHRYPGAQQTVYAALVNGTESHRRKIRLCPSHFELTVEMLEHNARSAQVAFDDPEAVKCLSCAKPVEDSEWQFFATVYATRAERQDYWSPVHFECVAAVVEDYNLPATMNG